jgi:hypothetical protein
MNSSAQATDLAMRKVASSIRVDTAYFAPPGEDRFDPVSLGIALGGILIGAFAKGFTAQASKYAEDAGRATAVWLKERIDELFREPEEQSVELARAALEEELMAARAAAAQLDEIAREKARGDTQAWLETAIGDFGLSTARAGTIAQSVATEAAALIG